MLRVVDDLADWNDFPWGEYYWKEFLNKVWILKSCVVQKTNFEKRNYPELFGPDSNPTIKLQPTDAEMGQNWYKRSYDYLDVKEKFVLLDNLGGVSQDDESDAFTRQDGRGATVGAKVSVANMFNVDSSTNKHRKDMSKTLRPNAPIVKDWISESKDETEIESVPKQKEPNFVPTSEHMKTPRESVKKVEHPKQDKNLRINNQKSRGHKKNWNKKAYFVCRSLNHLITMRNKWSRLVSLNAARLVLTAVPQSIVRSPRPVKHVVNKEHSPIRRPINHKPATKNSNFHKKVTTVKVNAVQGTKGNAEKASTNWVWKPKCTVLDHVSKLTSASMTFKKFDY
nr:hypothetical protein [Tanacetum cinerariifolium]